MPSKVLHVRNLPPDCTENELVVIACPFGRIQTVLILKGKNQGFIQMQDVASATALYNYYSGVQANIRGKNVYFQFSQHAELSSSQSQEVQNSIVLVSVVNLLYSVGIDVLYQVFSKYGTIMKIVIFTKPGDLSKGGDLPSAAVLQALIQFTDVASAVQAKMALDGQNIYSGCCTLRIQYSNLNNLNVKYNNEKSRDFTNPNLPTTSATAMHGYTAMSTGFDSMNQMGWQQPGGYNQYAASGSSRIGFNGAGSGNQFNGGSPVVIANNLDTDRCTADILFTLFGVYGDVIRVKILYNKKDTALIQFSNPQQAELAKEYLKDCPLHGNQLQVNISKHTSISLPRPGSEQENSNLTKDYTNSPLHRFKVVGSKNYHHICPPSVVLHVSNMPPEVSEETIRELFSHYGAVANFKFFPQKEPHEKKMALVQMSSVAEAVEALINLHNSPIEDCSLRVSFSNKNI